MNIIRITKTAKERFDAIFTGEKYIFLNPTFGLVAIAERKEVAAKSPYATRFEIIRTEQISHKLIDDTLISNEKRLTSYNVIITDYKNEDSLPQHTLPYLLDISLTIVDNKKSEGLAMSVKDMVQYKRTSEMEELYIMLDNDATAYRLWHDKAVHYAKAMHKGEVIFMELIASKMKPCITQSCNRLLNKFHKYTGTFLNVTKEQIEIVSWQWFYNDIMESYNFIKNKK